MKPEKVQNGLDSEERRSFTHALLRDIHALEQILSQGLIEENARRIGAEQELFLIDSNWNPAPVSPQILERIDDPHYTTELGAFNLELNLDPQTYGDNCLSRMEGQLNELIEKLRGVASEMGYGIILTGILPTIRKGHLGLENMTPNARYRALNDALSRMRGGAYEFTIKGMDELYLHHDSVMVEACNASFQVHFQVGAQEFARFYNLSQALAGPILAACCNSPLLFGRRLWAETRIALFQQAVDTRVRGQRHTLPRVTFGDRWVDESIVEIFREDVARFRPLIGMEISEDPIATLEAGEIPKLHALRLHNGTVYRWTRPCYGIMNGKPHLRIENRIFPSGPTVVDEVANAALWFGMLGAFASEYEDITQVMDFENANMNFLAAARQGLQSQFIWLDGEEISAQDLLLKRLIPQAHEALSKRGIVAADCDRYLGVIEERVRSNRSGARWMLKSYAAMKEQGTPGERLNALTAATIKHQQVGDPVHTWEPAKLEEAGGWKRNYTRLEQYMHTDLFTAHEGDSIELVANVMKWERIRYVLVEDDQHNLVGLVSLRSMLKVLEKLTMGEDINQMSIDDIMKRDLVTATPDTTTSEAIALMRQHRIGCLPVVDKRLVGVVTERDFMHIARGLIEQKLME